jgi:ubiquinone/menaquinone biosynthesis C-methylase UbiE
VSEADKAFTGSIPENYDRYLVPLIFSDYARDLAVRASALNPKSVLEVAAGSGAVTRELAPRLLDDAKYVVTDLNQSMLDYARAQQMSDTRLVWRQADAQALPFADSSFDVIICQFGVMFFPDRASAYREARRGLRSGARFLFSVWDSIEHNVFADDVTNALAELFPRDPPRFLARTPHGYFDPQTIRAELDSAGFSNVNIETIAKCSRAPSARAPAMAYCEGTPLRNEIEARGSLEQATAHAAQRIEQRHGSAELAVKMQALVVSATA